MKSQQLVTMLAFSIFLMDSSLDWIVLKLWLAQ